MSIARAEDALQRRAVLYDKGGDRHYDYISAWIKATRGSDPDASLYYLAVMLEGGEDPRFIVRRMVILASEDIGNADPGALDGGGRRGAGGRARGPARGHVRARAGRDLPGAGAEVERRRAGAGRGPAARARARRGAGAGVAALRAPARDRRSGGYDYPHDHPGHLSPQELLPEGVVGERFYEPDEAEAELARAAGARCAGCVGDNRGMAIVSTPPSETAARAGADAARARPRDGRRAGQVHGDAARADRRGGRGRGAGAAAVGAAARGGPRALHAPHGAGDHRRASTS